MIITNKPAYCIVRLYNRFIIFNCYGHFSKQNFEFLSFSSDCYLCNVTTYLTSSSSFSLSLSLSLSWIDSDSCQIGAGLKSIYSLCLSFPTVIVLALARTHFSLSLSITNRFISLELCLTTLTGVRLAICLSVFLSIYLFVYLSVYLFIYLSIYLYIYLFFSICSLKYLSQFGYFAFCLFSIN